jgi:MFS superfamily sulfate permease-like transporter
MNALKRWLPGLQVLSRYEAAWLPNDVMAGLVLTTMLVPVGIAYAVASGVPGIYGLYATIVRCSPMPCSVRAASWCWGRTPLSPR